MTNSKIKDIALIAGLIVAACYALQPLAQSAPTPSTISDPIATQQAIVAPKATPKATPAPTPKATPKVVLKAPEQAPRPTTKPTAASAPDWTVMPCSAWADTQYPTLPKYTYTDRCSAPDGSIIMAQ